MNLELISAALTQYGLKEAPGVADNQVILQLAKDAGFSDYIHDSIAWCSLFANWVAWKAAYERSKALNARSWLLVGEQVEDPQLGDVAVLWRDDPNGAFGHVGFWICSRLEDGKITVYLLAGNQNNEVCIEGFPISRVLGYRRLRKLS